MQIEKLEIEGAYMIQPTVHEDERGYFFESFNKEMLEPLLNTELNFIQDNESFSRKNTFRGFSFQKPPYTQSKLVRVTDGEVIDFMLDLRKNSSTFGKVVQTKLSSQNKKQVFIPKGCAHAFLVTSETATFVYKVDNKYDANSVAGVNPGSVHLDLDFKNLIINERDLSLPSFEDAYKFIEDVK